MRFYDAVRENSLKLNRMETDILRYVVASKDRVRQLSAKELAGHFYVAPNAITRLAHKLGFSGFNEMKSSYLVSLEERNFTIERTSLDESIVRTRELLNDRLVEEVVDAIESADQVVFFASGLSVLPCEDLCSKLKILGKHAEVLRERHVMTHTAKLLGSNDLLFAVSVSGETGVSIDSTLIAKARGVRVVTLTGLSKNRLASLADHALYAVDRQITYDDMDLNSRLAFYYVMEVIFERLFARVTSRGEGPDSDEVRTDPMAEGPLS